MTEATTPMPLRQAALLLLGDQSAEVQQEVRNALHRFAVAPRATYSRMIEAIDEVRGGPCLPFELTDDERLVTHALALNMRVSQGTGIAIFSNQSYIDAGALVVSNCGEVTYQDETAPNLQPLSSWLYPTGRDRYLQLRETLVPQIRPATFSLGKRLAFTLPVTRPTAAALQRSQLSVNLVDEQFASAKSGELGGADVAVSCSKDSLKLEVSRPEAILRMSAAAELGRWLRVESGSDFRAFLRLRPLSSKTRELDAVVSAVELNRQFVFVDSVSAIDVPASLWSAAWPSARFHASALTPIAMSHWQSQGLLPT